MDWTIPAIGTGQAWGEEGLSYTDPDPAIRAAAIERTISHIPFAARTGAAIIIGLLRGIVKPGVEHAQAMDWLVYACSNAALRRKRTACASRWSPSAATRRRLINNLTEGLELLDGSARRTWA